MQKDFVDHLKSRTSIVDVISRRVKLTKTGKDLFGLCPFHSEKTGSFKVDPEVGYYYCFGCGARGDVINFVMESEKLSFPEAIEFIANMYGIQMPQKDIPQHIFTQNSRIYAALNAIKDAFTSQLLDRCGLEAKKYLEARRISGEYIAKFQLGFAPENEFLISHLRNSGFSDDVLLKTGVFYKNKYKNELLNRFAGRLMFPIFDASGKCVGFGGRIIDEKNDSAKYINSPESEIFVKNQHLYGYSLARRSKTREIVITEGYLDVISMHQAGFDGAVAPLGTAISETQINMCWRVCDIPIISLDGDNAGIKASYRWIDRILSSLIPGKSFSFARLPEGSDPDSLIFNGQMEVVTNAVKNSMSLSDWMWEGAFALYPSETPEQKAAIVKMLVEKIDLIKDVSIKKLYFQYIKQKERELYRKKSNSIKKNVINVRSVIPVKEKMEKILLVTIVNHPYILDEVVENLAQIEFGVPFLKRIKESLLSLYEKRLTSEDGEMYAMAMKDIEKNVADIAKDVELHAGFSSKNATDEEAKKGWFMVCEKYFSDPIIAEDLQKVSSSLKSTFSEHDWQRLKALKKELLTNNRRHIK